MRTSSPVPPQQFTLNAPAATAVCLVGDFTCWQQHPVPMQRSRTGLWQTAVRLKPGTYHYRFLVDGEWRDDPACNLHAPNPFGSANGVRIVI